MLRKNFPVRKELRRRNALGRLKSQTARDADHAAFIKASIEKLEAKIKSAVK